MRRQLLQSARVQGAMGWGNTVRYWNKELAKPTTNKYNVPSIRKQRNDAKRRIYQTLTTGSVKRKHVPSVSSNSK